MITEDDSRETLKLADRYVIEPAFAEHRFNRAIRGEKLPDRFAYTSDRNEDWATRDDLMTMLATPRT
jgi:UDP-N-acetylglucosamine 4,6-dehydratase